MNDKAKSGQRTPEQDREQHAIAVERFNRHFPDGAKVWYLFNLPGGQFVKTTVRGRAFCIEEGNSDAGMPVVFLAGVDDCVSLHEIIAPEHYEGKP